MKINKNNRYKGFFYIVSFLSILFPIAADAAVNCGSSGAGGAFNPAANTTLTVTSTPFNYTTFNIGSGITVTINPAADPTIAATILASGVVTISGTLLVNGFDGGVGVVSTTNLTGGRGGPGGFVGGSGGVPDNGIGGSGIGPFPGNGGQSYSGGAGARTISGAFISLMPIIGGSGGGGGGGNVGNATAPASSGGAGGGGGGALVICSGSPATVGSIAINSTGIIAARGGKGGNGVNLSPAGGGGGGGAIRLIADIVTGSGTITTQGGIGGIKGTSQTAAQYDGTPGANGLIRFECLSCAVTGTTVSSATPALAPPAPVFPSPIPTLRITAIGTTSVPASPTASLTTPDVVLPTAVINPVPVTVTATNIPIVTWITVYNYVPGTANRASFGQNQLSGTLASSNATVSGNFPTGASILAAETNSFTVTASLAPYLPNVDGEEIKEMYAKGSAGGETELIGITGSGKEVPLIVKGDQILLASNAGLSNMP